MSLSIPISQLNTENVISSSDFIPIVQSSSLTTFKTPLTNLASWISSSVDASSSFSSVSSSFALSSSWAKSASIATTSNNLIYPNQSTASYAISCSQAANSVLSITASFALSTITGSTAVSASWASQSFWATSASFASRSLVTTSASFASRSFAATSASWASSSISSFSSTSASYSSQTLSSSYAVTASYAVISSWDAIYPYIKQITFTASHDDYVNINMLGTTWQSYGYEQCIALGNQGNGNTLWATHSVYYDAPNGMFKSVYGSVTQITQYYGITPVQNALMWADNRGGGPYYWYFTGSLSIVFATSPSTNITHTYFPIFANSYAGIFMRINAVRAKLGLNAIQNDQQLLNGNIVNVFNSFIIS